MCDKIQLTPSYGIKYNIEPTQNLNKKRKRKKRRTKFDDFLKKKRTDIASMVLSYKLVMLQISNHYTSMI